MNKLKFETMNLLWETQKALSDMGYVEPTPIQSMAIFPVLSGRDIIGQAQTGTGKTLAYAIPVVEMVEEHRKDTQFLVLCPTRELALQVSEIVKGLLKYRKRANVVPIYGGQSIDFQIRAIKKGAQIIVGTPGRIMDHMRRGTLKFNNVKMIVLDEADEMLNMGFIEDIRTILSFIPDKRQTTLFSATMPKAILELSKKFQKNQEFLRVVQKELVVKNVKQFYLRVYDSDKIEILSRLLSIHNPDSAMVFCNTKKKVNEVIDMLKFLGYDADALHGDLRQPARDKVMNAFRSKAIKILVATDVAARGIDVDNVEIIFNYDLPQYHEYYVHRVGRTGRMGKKGKAFTFVTGSEMDRLNIIQKYAKITITPISIPSLREIEGQKRDALVKKIKAKMMVKEDMSLYKKIVKELVSDENSIEDLVLILLKMLDRDEMKHIAIKKVIKEPLKKKKRSSERKRLSKSRKRNIDDFWGYRN